MKEISSQERGDAIESDDKYYQSVRDYEVSLEEKDQQTKALGWRLFYVSVAIICMLLGLMTVLVLAHKPTVFEVEVDKSTGQRSILLPLNGNAVDRREIEVKRDIQVYVLARERYYYGLLQDNYDQVRSMSTPEVFSEYDKQFEGDNALDRVLGAGTEWRASVVGIRLSPDDPNKAVVTFERAIYRGLQLEKTVRFTASMAYKYNQSWTDRIEQLIRNTSGFKVYAYRTDAEFSNGAKR